MISLDHVSIRQGKFSLNDVCLSIESGQYGILMGPTGSGKTTLAEAICGLRRTIRGKILLDGKDVAKLAPAARNVGYVPQDAVLFPTMRVDRQIAFSMDVRGQNQEAQMKRVRQLAELLSIAPLLNRYPAGLSGGEKQRVALARALSSRPRLLCLDEPLGALDDETRTQMIEQLRNVHSQEGITVLHITHNIDEARKLGTVQFRLQQGAISRV